MSGKGVVHRIAGLPAAASRQETQSILDEIFGPEVDVTIRSLGLHHQITDSAVAVVRFSPVPTELQKGFAWKKTEVAKFRGQFRELDLEIDITFLGLTPLNVVDDSEQGQIDCIAVSGLSSHPFGSWKERGGSFMWLVDGGADVWPSNVRRFLWGYDTSLIDSESFQDITDIGGNLAVTLRTMGAPFGREHGTERERHFEARPIVFLAHSLGGLVVKEAIIRMAQNSRARARCVYGLVLFGVPHFGLLVKPWLQIVRARANEDLIRDLQPGSRYLRILDEEFRKQFSTPHSKVITVYETMNSPTTKEESPGVFNRSGDSQILVDRNSACGFWPDSVTHVRLSSNRTHENLPKFGGRHDADLIALRPLLEEIWRSAFADVQKRFSTREQSRLAERAKIDDTGRPAVHGLAQMWPRPEFDSLVNIETEADLIAIHGLGGHPQNTWTAGKHSWLEDFLPVDLPQLRIMVFGYNDARTFSGSGSNIENTALDLLEDITRLWRQEGRNKRRIIFVCHSLGGLVFKEAAMIAKKSRSRYRPIAESMSGVLFLGTPQKGRDNTYWEELLTKLNGPESVLDQESDAVRNSDGLLTRLGDICSSFLENCNRLQIFSLYEQLEGLENETVVVDQASSILHVLNEIALPLHSDHINLSRYLTSSSREYQTVSRCITELLDTVDQGAKAESQETDKDFEVADEEAFLESLPVPWGHSSHWLLAHEYVKSWMSAQQHGRKIIWLHGSPGSGKTVLIRDLLVYLIGQIHTMDDEKPPIRKPIYFFFDDKRLARNSSLEFVRSAIGQILLDKRMELPTRHLDLRNSVQQLKKGNEDAFWKLLYTIIQRSRGVLFLFVIDAIDEVLRNAPINSVTIIDRLQELHSVDLSGRVRLLVSDRKKRLYGFRPEDIATIEVDNEVTTSTVNEFIRTRLRRGFEMSNVSPSAGKEVERKIIEIAQGNFLHASLSLEQFASNVQRWDRDQIVQGLKRLNTLSRDFAASYCRLLARIAQPYRRRAKASFAILRVCQETLTLRQLSFFATLYEALQSSPEQMPFLEVKNLMRQCIDFEDYVTGTLGYIIKEAADGIVSFAHVSVKDLWTHFSNPDVQLPEHADVLKEFTMSEADAHCMMHNLCFTTLQLEDMSSGEWARHLENIENEHTEIILESSIGLDPTQKIIKATKSKLETISKTPCLVYAISHSLGHFQEASAIPTIDLKAVSVLHSRMGYVSYALWLLLSQIGSSKKYIKPEKNHERSLAHEPSSDAVLSRILARGDFPRLVQFLITRGAGANVLVPIPVHEGTKANGASMLSWAIICKQRDSFDLLLGLDTTKVDSGAVLAAKPLHFAVECDDDLHFIQRLIQHPECNINVTFSGASPPESEASTDHGTPLHLAYRRGNSTMVDLLLDQPHIDVWSKGGSGESPYSMTFKYGKWQYLWEKMLKISGKSTEDVLAENVSGISQIFAAGVYGWTHVEEKILFENPRQLLAVDPETKMSPLTTYAYFGRRDKLLWILDRLPTDFPLRDHTDRYDLLHLCAHHDWEDIVHLLQQRFGLKSLESDHTGRTLLHWAIEHFWDMSRMNLADFSGHPNLIDKKDRDGLTALHLAVIARNFQAVEALAATGADCLLADKHGNTPAHLAADLGFRSALNFFIDRKEREFGRTRSGASLLHLISMWFDGATVDRFVAAKRALVNVVDKQRLTPLHYAAIANNLSVIDVLVDLGSNIDARSASRTTPLHEAIRSGSVGAALLLMKLGADYHAVDGFRQNCLHLSCRYGHDELISRLFNLRCDSTITDAFGMRVLHRACASDKATVALQLLEGKADWTAKDKYRRSALDLAVLNRAVAATTAVVKWLYRQYPHSRTRKRLFDRALKVAYEDGRGTEIKNVLTAYGARYEGPAVQEFIIPPPEFSERRARHMQVVVWSPPEDPETTVEPPPVQPPPVQPSRKHKDGQKRREDPSLRPPSSTPGTSSRERSSEKKRSNW